MPRLSIGDIGPCEIVWGYGESGALTLGPFLGGVTLRMDTTVHDVKEDRAGEAAVDAAFGGSVMELEVPMTRSTLTQLNEVLLAGGVVDSGDHEYIKLVNQIGCFMYDLSRSLVIKPICNDEVGTDPAEWIQIYVCYPIPAIDLTYAPDTQRLFPIKFKVFVCQESPYVGDFGTLGMPSGSTEDGL